MKLGLPQIGHLIVAGLGFVVFFLGFANVAEQPDGTDSASFYGTVTAGFSWVPTMLAVGGLLSLKAVLPGDDKKPGLLPPVLVTTTVWAFLFTVFSMPEGGDLGAGGIMVMIFGILQMLAAIATFLLDAGIIKMPQPNPYGQQGMYPPSGVFPQQAPPSGAFPQQPQQQPQPGQQTTFAPQQGQFGQPGQPGTPPGGYPQQG